MLFSQLKLFFMILFSRNSGVIYYLNTITPFAAWACRLSNKNFFYHVHENITAPGKTGLRFISLVIQTLQPQNIFVSHYLKTTAINCRDGIVVYNALHPDFIAKAKHYVSSGADKKQTILMVASLRRFKGIYEFVEIAKKMPQYLFELVLSETKAAVEHFTIEAEILII